MVLTITNENFNKEVISSDKPVLIDFWATWCPPCMMQGPIIDEFAELHPEIKVCKVNVDEQPDLANMFSVVNIPTLVFVKGGKTEKVLVGLRSKQQLEAELL